MVNIVKGDLSMMYTESAMKVRQNLGEILNKVQYRHDSVLITKADRPVAALIDIALYKKIRQMRDTFEKLTNKLSKTYANVETSIAENEISDAIKAVRGSSKKKSK